MYKREFENLIRSQKVPKSTLFYGACPYQNDLLLSQTLQALDIQSDEKLSLYYDEFIFSSAKNFLSQSSLFGDRNILVIKTDKVIPTKELDILLSLCLKNETSYLFYQYFGEDKKATSMTKSFDKKYDATFVRFFKAEQNEAITMLLAHANTLNLSINRYAMQHLYMVHMEALSLCANEFEKLFLLGKEIEVNDIDTFVYGLGSVSMDHFIIKLLDKKDFKEDFSRMIESDGNDEIRIVNAIQNYISQLFLFHAYIKLNGAFDAKAILGYPLPPQLANQRANQSIKIDLKTYKTLLDLLIQTEFKLKKMQNIEKNAMLLSTLIKLQSYL